MTSPDLTIFLDFDGVLHPLWEPAPFNDWTLERIQGPKPYKGPFFVHAPVLVDLLRPHLSGLDIVISSTWGRKRDLATLRSLLPAELAAHVTDAVHHHLPSPEAIDQGKGFISRWTEIQWYRDRVRPDIGNHWLAVDDDNSEWPAHAAKHLVHCNRDLGDPASQQAIEDALLLFRFIHPFADDIAKIQAPGNQPGAVGLDETGNLVKRGEDGQLHPCATTTDNPHRDNV